MSRTGEGLESEQALVERARCDPAAFGELYERYVDAIHAFAFHRMGDTAHAEDVTAETFQRALERLDTFEWRGVPFSAWLYRIASNVIAARFRRQVPLVYDAPLEDQHDGLPEPEVSLIHRERVAELMAAVRTLPDDQQQAIVLRFGAELRSKEIAYIMERSEAAVKALLHRALTGLHRRLAGRPRMVRR